MDKITSDYSNIEQLLKSIVKKYTLKDNVTIGGDYSKDDKSVNLNILDSELKQNIITYNVELSILQSNNNPVSYFDYLDKMVVGNSDIRIKNNNGLVTYQANSELESRYIMKKKISIEVNINSVKWTVNETINKINFNLQGE